MPNPLEGLQANYQGSDGNWYDDDGNYIGSGSNATHGTQEVLEDTNIHEVAKAIGSKTEKDVIADWAKANGYRLNNDTIDYIYNQFFTEKNNASAWERTLSADSTKYQRMVEDMKKAGLNPFLAISGSASNAGSAPAGSVGSGSIASRYNQKLQSGTQAGQAILQVIGSILGAIIMAAAFA